jgi:AcrR family transcriptional regulator
MPAKLSKTSTSPWTTKPDRAAVREEKREAVLRAAAQAFSGNGYYKTSLDDIAAALGITKPTLYYYAKNKEDLIAAVGARALDRMLAELPGDPRASGYDQLRTFLRNYAQAIATDFGRCLVLLTDADLSGVAGTLIRDGKAAVDLRLRGLIEKGIADGSIGECDPKLTAFMLAGALNGIPRWYREGGGLDTASISEIYVNQLGNGLRPRP